MNSATAVNSPPGGLSDSSGELSPVTMTLAEDYVAAQCALVSQQGQ